VNSALLTALLVPVSGLLLALAFLFGGRVAHLLAVLSAGLFAAAVVLILAHG